MQSISKAVVLAAICAGGLLSGCSTLRPDPTASAEYRSAKNAIESYEDSEGNYIRPEGLRAEKKKNSLLKLPQVPFFGSKPEDHAKAREEYAKADEIFNQATNAQGDERKELFRKAAKQYKLSAKYWPSSALEQDAWLMAGESSFFAEDYPDAEDTYVKLFANYPRTRFEDLINKRRMEIGLYWIRHDRADHKPFYVVNFTDDTRPWNDTGNHGKRVLEKMRLDSPTGRLADDSTMELANNAFQKGNYEEAADLYEDLRTTYPDSPHQFDAHFLGLKAVMQTYQGYEYDGQALDRADKLLKQIQRQFPDQAREQEEYLRRTYAEIQYRRAERLMAAARYRMNREQNGAAIGYLNQIVSDYEETPFAEEARKELAQMGERPLDPERHFSWLADLVPRTDPVSQIRSQVDPIKVPNPTPLLDDLPKDTQIAETPSNTSLR